VDRDLHWLRQFYKYDVDTLTELEEPEGYDYLIETAGDEEFLPDLIERSNPSAKVLLLGLSCIDSMQTLPITGPGKHKVFHGSLATQPDTWREAIRMVHRGVIRLDDHTAAVESLEGYRKAWAAVETGESFKVLLKVSEELEAL